jgi:hypothetical protein
MNTITEASKSLRDTCKFPYVAIGAGKEEDSDTDVIYVYVPPDSDLTVIPERYNSYKVVARFMLRSITSDSPAFIKAVAKNNLSKEDIDVDAED